MAEYIIKSRAVFDGRADSCKPLAVWIKDDRIKKLLPYDETDKCRSGGCSDIRYG